MVRNGGRNAGEKPVIRAASLLVAVLLLRPLAAQQSAAPTTIYPIDIFTAFHLPAYADNSASPLFDAAASLQVNHRAILLGLSGHSAIEAWNAAQLLTAPGGNPGGAVFTFTGTVASDLNRLLEGFGFSRIRIAAPVLTFDEPLVFPRSGVTIDFGNAQLVASTKDAYLIRIENTQDITLQGGEVKGGLSAVLVNNSSGVQVQQMWIQDTAGPAIVVTGSTKVWISGNRIERAGAAGILLHRGTTASVISANHVSGGVYASNVTAGIVISDREVDLAANPVAIFSPDQYGVVPQKLSVRIHPPHDNLIDSNTVSGNLSSGIYSDGGVRNVITSNVITGNGKEGLCLDNGSTANVVAANRIEGNGRRWGESDLIMQREAIAAGGRLADGTPAEKVPGVSIDNGMYNIVFSNGIAHNFGGGIKMVRTGWFNALGLNTLFSDNEGAGDSFHFFGTELGATPIGDPDLDATPSRGNIVFSNVIRGTHYSGVFLAPGSDQNTISGNLIFDATNYALESAEPMVNTVTNNLTDLPSLNTTAGLDPALVGH
jgi:parallel beta-helix repeat protein